MISVSSLVQFVEICMHAFFRMSILPNICITGTPGTGKTSLAKELCRRVEALLYVDLGHEIKTRKLFSEWDDEFDASILDEDKVLQFLNSLVLSRPQGGIVVDFHSVGFLPSDSFAGAVVLRADTNVLWDRLAARGYSEAKVKENVESEIFQTSLEEAAEAFGEDQIMERPNNNLQDAEDNLKLLTGLFGRV